MKIGFASADWSSSIFDSKGRPSWGGSGWARLGQYADLLTEHEVVVGKLVGNGKVFGVRESNPDVDLITEDVWTGDTHLDCDIVVMQRWMLADVAHSLQTVRASGQIIINDVDDWYWGLDSRNLVSAALNRHPEDSWEYYTENVEHYKNIVCNSSLITVSTEFLAERIQKWTKTPVVLVPNSIDLGRFSGPRTHINDTPVIGWVGSTINRSGDLETISSPLKRLEREGFKFHHSGHMELSEQDVIDGYMPPPTFAEMTGLNPNNVTTMPQVPPEMYADIFQFDIGVAPLNHVPFNEAKSYIKALEYAASGIPFVAEEMGEYSRLRKTYGIGRTAKNADQWFKHIMKLADPTVRQQESDVNFSRLAPHSIQMGASLWNQIFNACS